MRVLVTGKQGQLVRSLIERSAYVSGLDVLALGRPELDLLEPSSAAEAVRRISPDVVISAAAYTAVDQAEDEPKIAYRVNGEAPGELAGAAQEIGARMIHVSTDYVFDGSAAGPYRPDAATNPLGIYGKSKLLGEEQVRSAYPEALIVRTAWVYSPFGRNFVKTMLTAAGQRDELSVVSDQVGNPTSALDIADALLAALKADAPLKGTCHFAGADAMSWAEFAERIFETSIGLDGPTARVNPIGAADWPVKAPRPANSRLDSSEFEARFGYAPQPLALSLRRDVSRILDGLRIGS